MYIKMDGIAQGIFQAHLTYCISIAKKEPAYACTMGQIQQMQNMHQSTQQILMRTPI